MSETLNKFKLDNRLVVITGGAGLLGVKHSEAIIEAGGDIVLIDINESKLKDSESHFRKKYSKEILGLKVDITSEEEVLLSKEKIYNTFQKYPDILINNAAIDPKMDGGLKKNLSRFENFMLNQWNTEIAVGLTGAMLCSKIFGIEMANNHNGVILNVSSDLGIIAPDQRIYRRKEVSFDQQNVKPVTYSVIKHGLIGLTKYIATYWADKGVRVNAICPGGVYTNQPQDFVKNLSRLIPMNRMAEEDEYKAAIIFMVSEASSYMNGATVSIDGGRTVW
jgi:NAD(P)-dependent dehydrogenase (short-subunit alcohol dehydrogenase family)